MGQRQTDSGSVTFDGVAVAEQEIVQLSADSRHRVRSTLRVCINQFIFANIYVSIASGALSEAAVYARGGKKEGGPQSVTMPVTSDPYVLGHVGDMSTQLQVAEALVGRANDLLQDAWDVGLELTEQQRGTWAVVIAAAKVAPSKAFPHISSRMFDVMGSRATPLGPCATTASGVMRARSRCTIRWTTRSAKSTTGC